MTDKQEKNPFGDKFEKVENEGSFWKPLEIGEKVQGELIDVTEGNFGDIYKLKTDSGDEILLPSHAVLLNRMKNANIGDHIGVILVDKELPKVKGQHPTMMYDVYINKKQ